MTLNASAGFFSGENYTVDLQKDGYSPQTLTVASGLDGWYVGNILFGGLIGLLIIDPATGAMWKLPESTTATLAEETASLILKHRDKELRIAFVADVSGETVSSDMTP